MANYMANYEQFKENLQSLINRRGFSIRETGVMTGVSAASISRYLSGDRYPDLDCVIKISQSFGVTIEWLLGYTDNSRSGFGADMKEIERLYYLASYEDRQIINAILKKYDENKN